MSEADWSQRIYFITNNVIILYPAHRVRTNKLPFSRQNKLEDVLCATKATHQETSARAALAHTVPLS